jgi:hypothetical protein
LVWRRRYPREAAVRALGGLIRAHLPPEVERIDDLADDDAAPAEPRRAAAAYGSGPALAAVGR